MTDTDTDTDTVLPISDKQKVAVLQRALDHIQRNQVAAAEALLAQILQSSGEEPDALQLMGVIRRMQGANADAEVFYRRSLAAKPDQPQVHHNLGNLLKASGRLDEAIASQREAIRLKRNYLEAHLNLGLALFAKGDHAAAEKSFRDALRIQPKYIFAQQSLGALFNETNRPKDAELILRRALASGSQDLRQIAALEHNLGVSVLLQNRPAEALALFDAAQAKVPNLMNVDYNRGNALQQLGQLEAAVAAYRRAINSDALNMLAHRDLNHLLYRLKEDDQFLRSYDDAMAFLPEVGDLPLAKATFLFQKEDYEGARENFTRAAALMTQDVMPRDGLGLTLARIGDFDAAIHAHEDAVKLEPENAHAWRNFAETLLRAGDARKAAAAAQSSLAIDPDDQGAIAMLSTAARMFNEGGGETLNDYENLVQTFEIAPPEGYNDIESFNRDLNEYLDRLHVDKREVLMQTLRGGTQTLGDVFGRGHDLIERLRVRIDQAVGAYIAGMKDDAEHPLFRRRRKGFAYSGSWSARLHDCGYHTNHFHTKGWISSAYYVAVPDAAQDASAKQGWLKFGEPAFETGIKDPVRRIVQPQVGKLVLFPSYMWHGTIPFHSQQSRTSIAFDVVPR
jgi:tetratricopeptide (TPR) repeat protein